jgi:hypothetical protein
LKPDPARQVDPGLEPGRVDEKIENPVILSKIKLQPVDFYFCFLFFN